MSQQMRASLEQLSQGQVGSTIVSTSIATAPLGGETTPEETLSTPRHTLLDTEEIRQQAELQGAEGSMTGSQTEEIEQEIECDAVGAGASAEDEDIEKSTELVGAGVTVARSEAEEIEETEVDGAGVTVARLEAEETQLEGAGGPLPHSQIDQANSTLVSINEQIQVQMDRDGTGGFVVGSEVSPLVTSSEDGTAVSTPTTLTPKPPVIAQRSSFAFGSSTDGASNRADAPRDFVIWGFLLGKGKGGDK